MSKRVTYYVPGLRHAQPIPFAAKVGNVLYSSPIQGIDAETGQRSDDVYEQAVHCFKNLRLLLGVAGATPEDIVRMTCFLADLGDREALNKPWLEMFPDEDDRPARHTLKYDPPGPMKVQIDIVAVLD